MLFLLILKIQNMIELKNLLENIKKIVDRSDEISRLKGEKFNIFSILNLTTSENNLHSKFLNELLNINGSHGQKEIFLELFIKMLQGKTYDKIELSPKNSLVFIEKPIGIVDFDKKIGGRIDILIQDQTNKTEIIIENKIFAREQPNQIERYCNYAKKNKSKVFYLTLQGEKPLSFGKYILDEDYFTLSYSIDIIQWLEFCLKEVSDFPIIRETIKQYIITIKKLTGQLSDKKMSKELKTIILNNYNEAKQISDSLAEIQLDIDNFWKDVCMKIETNQTFITKNWKVGKNNESIIIDVLGHDRGNFNVYIENIFSEPLYCIWLNKQKYDIKKIEAYVNQNNLDFDLSDNYILKSPTDYNFNLLNLKNLNFYDIDNRNHLIYNLSGNIIKIAEKYEQNLIEINEFKNM